MPHSPFDLSIQDKGFLPVSVYVVVNLREKARNQERGVRGGRSWERGVKAVHVALRAGHSHSFLHYSALHSTQRRGREGGEGEQA